MRRPASERIGEDISPYDRRQHRRRNEFSTQHPQSHISLDGSQASPSSEHGRPKPASDYAYPASTSGRAFVHHLWTSMFRIWCDITAWILRGESLPSFVAERPSCDPKSLQRSRQTADIRISSDSVVPTHPH